MVSLQLPGPPLALLEDVQLLKIPDSAPSTPSTPTPGLHVHTGSACSASSCLAHFFIQCILECPLLTNHSLVLFLPQREKTEEIKKLRILLSIMLTYYKVSLRYNCIKYNERKREGAWPLDDQPSLVGSRELELLTPDQEALLYEG